MPHLNIVISGKVQGVFFRASAMKEATTRGLRGFVCNEDDGSVYAEVEGESEALDLFVEWCGHGPPHAKVETVKAEPGPEVGFASFEIRRT